MSRRLPTIGIGIIGSRGLPPAYGGTEVYVEQLATKLAEYGDEIWVYGCARQNLTKNWSDCSSYPKNIHLVVTPTIGIRYLDNFLRSLFASLQVISNTKIDVVEYTNYGPAFFAFIPKLFGKRVVVSIRALDATRSKWGPLAKSFLRLCEYLSVKFADKMTTNSRQAAQYFNKRYGLEPMFIPNGAVMEKSKPDCAILKSYGLTPLKYILYAGRLVPEKGLHTLLEAFNRASLHDTKLVIAGAHESSKKYLQRLLYLANERVVFVGHQQGGSIAALYQHAAVFVLPSIVEGMSNSLLSAMAYARPVIVSDIEENIFVVSGARFGRLLNLDAAVVFKSGDAALLANALEKLLGEPDEINLRGQGLREHVTTKFNWTTSVATIRNVYLEAISRQS